MKTNFVLKINSNLKCGRIKKRIKTNISEYSSNKLEIIWQSRYANNSHFGNARGRKHWLEERLSSESPGGADNKSPAGSEAETLGSIAHLKLDT